MSPEDVPGGFRYRWTDDRLDDWALSLRELPMAMVEMQGDLKQATAGVHNCHEAVRELREGFDQYKEDEREEKEQERRDRKADRRWTITAIFAAAGLVISALGLLAGRL